ncbi:MAG: hypothetical protein DHS20C16_19020 [Phycisphaerae bacterium]|nr:MAG: hypothetical protein DHS20C16_19020 [Phycisphaerae bacterium]
MAQKFKFRLETVRRVRQLDFEDKQRIVAERLRRIGSEQAIIAALEVERTSMNDETKRLLSGGHVNVDGVSRYRIRVGYLRDQILDAENRILEHEKTLAVERAAMVKASVAVKAIEKLKERKLAAYELQLKRLEMVEQDETAQQMHLRTNNSLNNA